MDISDYNTQKHEFQHMFKGQSFFRTLAVALYQPRRPRQAEVKNESGLAREIEDWFEKDYPVVRALLGGIVNLSVVEELARCISARIRTQLPLSKRIFQTLKAGSFQSTKSEQRRHAENLLKEAVRMELIADINPKHGAGYQIE
ncbi:hypothetical protein BG004_005127 [Podila humilis]|nr:hypothetical protein BG004_005127 [Podila humilis]